MEKTQSLPFPIRGISRSLAHSSQPDLTAWDMLNVIPLYPESGRLQGGKRWGTERVWADAIGDGIIFLDQLTYLTDTSNGTEVGLLDDTFSYAAGAELSTGSGGVWTLVKLEGGIGADSIRTTGTTARLLPVSAPASIIAVLTNQLAGFDTSLPYVVQATFTMPAMDTNGQTATVILESERTIPDTGGLIEGFAAAIDDQGTSGHPNFTLTLYFNGSPVESPVSSVAITAATPFTLKIAVSSSRLATVSLNGVSQVTHQLSAATAARANFSFTLSNLIQSGIAATADDFVVTGGVSGTRRQTKIIAVSSRDVIMGDITASDGVVTGGSDVIVSGVTPQGTYLNRKSYIVDGNGSPKQVNVTTQAMEAFTETAGTVPPNMTLAWTFRGRLYLGDSGGNFYASRIGDAHDWDFSASDPAGAFDGAASTAGRISDTLTAGMPLGDDLLILGGDHTLHLMVGDLKAGGSIDVISNQCGVFGPKAWTRDPSGVVFFVGSGGLYRWTKGERPVCVSNTEYNQFFRAIDRSRTVCTLVWDTDNQGMHLFFYERGISISTAPTHLWYDARTSAVEEYGASLFPYRMPIGHGPPSAILYDGDSPTDRVLLLGGRDGVLRSFAASGVYSDDGDPIETYVDLGPHWIGGTKTDGFIKRFDLTIGEPPAGSTAADISVDVTIKAGLTAYDVTEGAATAKLHTVTRTFAGQHGRVTALRAGTRGVFAAVRLGNTSADKTWSFEQAFYDAERAGMTRR